MTRILTLLLLLLLVTEIGPPIYRASVLEGLAVVEAHDKPPKDPPKPDPRPGPDLRDPHGVGVEPRDSLWWVVRITRPTEPVFGPWLTPEPECRGWERRFPSIYRCVRLP